MYSSEKQLFTRVSILALLAATLSMTSGCSAVPSNGPLAVEVRNSGADGASYAIPKTNIVFDVVGVDQRVANSVTTLGLPSLVRTFGVGGATGQPVIGIGDELQVTIFEAGADGLFSTSERKQTMIPVIVQPDGHGQIPYAGSVRFAGKTLDGAREEIASALKAKAVEPDVIVGMSKNSSRTASVQGDVRTPNIIPIGLSPLPLTSAIAMAGGASKAPYDTYVTLTRGRKSGTVLLQSIIDNPKDDINISPRDKVFLTYDPQSFTILGSTEKTGKISFQASSISLVEATAMAGGANLSIADPAGYFIFRYESEAVYREVVGESRFRQLLSKGMMANKDGRYPIVYRIDMNDPQSYIVTQSFPIRNKDVLYLSRHPATDFAVFMRLIGGPVSVARNVQRL
jgi:polysaccharide export outer membrane protein